MDCDGGFDIAITSVLTRQKNSSYSALPGTAHKKFRADSHLFLSHFDCQFYWLVDLIFAKGNGFQRAIECSLPTFFPRPSLIREAL
jgi:hypothetical protein